MSYIRDPPKAHLHSKSAGTDDLHWLQLPQLCDLEQYRVEVLHRIRYHHCSRDRNGVFHLSRDVQDYLRRSERHLRWKTGCQERPLRETRHPRRRTGAKQEREEHPHGTPRNYLGTTHKTCSSRVISSFITSLAQRRELKAGVFSYKTKHADKSCLRVQYNPMPLK